MSSKLNFKKIIWCHSIPGERVYCNLYDGSELFSIIAEGSILKINESRHINSVPDKDNVTLFIDDEPINNVYTSEYLMSINSELEKIHFIDLTRHKITYKANPDTYGSNYFHR